MEIYTSKLEPTTYKQLITCGDTMIKRDISDMLQKRYPKMWMNIISSLEVQLLWNSRNGRRPHHPVMFHLEYKGYDLKRTYTTKNWKEKIPPDFLAHMVLVIPEDHRR